MEGEPSVTLLGCHVVTSAKKKNLIDLTSRLLCHDYPHFIFKKFISHIYSSYYYPPFYLFGSYRLGHRKCHKMVQTVLI